MYGLPATVQVVFPAICPHTEVLCGAAKPRLSDLAANNMNMIKVKITTVFLNMMPSRLAKLLII
jgi:hypothetical protein